MLAPLDLVRFRAGALTPEAAIEGRAFVPADPSRARRVGLSIEGLATSPEREEDKVAPWGSVGRSVGLCLFLVLLSTAALSDEPRFDVVVPPVEVLWQKAVERSRPRSLPPAQELAALRHELEQGSRASLFHDLRQTVTQDWNGAALTPEPPLATFEVENFYERIRVARSIADEVHRATTRLTTVAYAFAITHDGSLRDEAWRRAQDLLAWNPEGATGLRSSDLSNLRIALALALVYDLLGPALDESRRGALRRMIETRSEAAFNAYVVDPDRALERRPYNSHGFRQAGAILAIALLLAGDSEPAQRWFHRTWPAYLGVANPWGGGNGVNYGIWDQLNSFQYWDVVRNAVGVDLAAMAWPRQSSLFFSYSIPPGTPNSAFGDGGEHHRPETWALFATLQRQRIDTRLSRRFAALWPPEREDYFLHLFGPLYEAAERPFDPAQHPALPDAAGFPSIGWVAMHSELDDPERYSILFKSSPDGSFGHGHADQNSFIINGRQRSLAIDSGYYDTWKSRHHEAWTIQTRAHNAITYDGGHGQLVQDPGASGHIVDFARCDGYDMAVGDAAEAYGGALETAIRTILYLRPDVVLIYDALEAAEPRVFEWNLHATNAIERQGHDGLAIRRGKGAVCFRVLAAPRYVINQSDRFTEDPDPFFVPDWQAQWHLRLAARERRREAEFLVVADLGCNGSVVDDLRPRTGGGFTLSVDGTSVAIGPTGSRAAGPGRAPRCETD